MSVKKYTIILSALLTLGFITQWFVLDSRAFNMEVEIIATTDTILSLADEIQETHKVVKDTNKSMKRVVLDVRYMLLELRKQRPKKASSQ